MVRDLHCPCRLVLVLVRRSGSIRSLVLCICVMSGERTDSVDTVDTIDTINAINAIDAVDDTAHDGGGDTCNGQPHARCADELTEPRDFFAGGHKRSRKPFVFVREVLDFSL